MYRVVVSDFGLSYWMAGMWSSGERVGLVLYGSLDAWA